MELKKVSNKHDSKEYVSLFVLNDFLKFDRKIYQVFGLQLGRPLSLKLFIYVFFIGGIELIWYFIPVLNRLIIWLPPGVLFAIPFVLAWLLSDVGTEGRSPITFFKSLIFYHLRSLKRDRKSTRLNSSHVAISYAVFCLKKKICISFLF